MNRLDTDPAQLARTALDAINSRDGERIRPLLADAVEVVTGRAVHRGPDAVVAWAQKRYEHLERHYLADELRIRGDAVLALGAVQYRWRESGEVGDSTPIAIELGFEGERLRRLVLHDDAQAALTAFES